MPAAPLEPYLKAQKQAFLSLPSSPPPKVTLVSGNESGDLDSLVCALSVAYAIGNSVFPIVQTRAQDISLRPENILALQSGGVNHDDVLNLDDVEKTLSELKGQSSLDVVLVDHNRSTSNLSRFNANVIAVLDHHVDEGLYTSADPRVLLEPQDCGSCSSLVTRAYQQGWFNKLAPSGQAQKLTPDIARLLLSANLIDTHNLDPKIGKAKSVDHEAAEYQALLAKVSITVEASEPVTISAIELKNGAPQDLNTTQFHHALSQAKNDISGLNTMQLLTRDYKQYEWDGPEETKWHVGLGTVPQNFASWIAREGKDKFLAGCKEFSKERQISLLGILTSFEAEGRFQREIAVYAPSGQEEFRQYVQTAERTTKESLDLAPLQSINDALKDHDMIYFWQQRQTRSTRKQVAPAFQQVASQVHPPQ